MCEYCSKQQKQGFIICENCGVFLIEQDEFEFNPKNYKPLFTSIREVVKKNNSFKPKFILNNIDNEYLENSYDDNYKEKIII